MDLAQWLFWLLSFVPGGTEIAGILLHGSVGDRIKATVAIAVGVAGSAEVVKLVFKVFFRLKTRMARQLEEFEKRIEDQHGEIVKLRETQKQLEKRLQDDHARHPEAAIARAEREFRDGNFALAGRHLEEWFNNNAGNIANAALHLARYHISQAVPNPGDHLKRADQMLRLVRGATPENGEANQLSGEFFQINAALQEQVLRNGDEVIAWNSSMGNDRGRQTSDLLPIVSVFHNIARYCIEKGLVRLAPLFADRASDWARGGGPPLRMIWCRIEIFAVQCLVAAGHLEQALERIDHILAEPMDVLPVRSIERCNARYSRAEVLRWLGRYAEALREIDAFASIETEVRGARHPETLVTRYLRATALQSLGRGADALGELDALVPTQTEILGPRHPTMLSTRSLRASVLQDLGRHAEALSEINIFGPVEVEVKGARHPDVLTTRHLRASRLLKNPLTSLESL
jgi:tetratricopeptide (TPR) repeat protein